MKKLALLFGFGAFMVMAGPAQAQVNVGELQELAEDAMATDCAAKVAEAGKSVGPAWKNMRTSCKALRTCKKTCRQAKRSAKKGARAEKRDCKQECKGKKGAAKKACKKSCRKAFKGAKRAARGATQNCKVGCRAQYKDAGCKSARKAFWKEIKNTIQSAGPACAQDAQAFFNG
jgi:hypothetical protein